MYIELIQSLNKLSVKLMTTMHEVLYFLNI